MKLLPFAIGALAAVASASASAQTVPVTPPPTYSYEAHTVRQMEVRGQFGRYITFIGKTVNTYEATSGHYNPGSPGYVSCVAGICRRIGYIAPRYTPGTPGGTQERNFTYELDCVDMTFDRKGDRAGGIYNRGWMPVGNDPTASEVARIYCPKISTLPGGPPTASTTQEPPIKSVRPPGGSYSTTDWIYLGEYGEGADKEKVYTRRIGSEFGMPVEQALYVKLSGEREEGSATVWDCNGYHYRFQDEDKWTTVDRGTQGEKELKVLCTE